MREGKWVPEGMKSKEFVGEGKYACGLRFKVHLNAQILSHILIIGSEVSFPQDRSFPQRSR